MQNRSMIPRTVISAAEAGNKSPVIGTLWAIRDDSVAGRCGAKMEYSVETRPQWKWNTRPTVEIPLLKPSPLP